MKNNFLVVLLLTLSLITNAQTPQSIPYQAVIRNTDVTVMAEAAITMTFKIHDVTATGIVVYEENHTSSTNAQGLISLNVGNGSVVSGTFSGINWGNGAKFLHVLMNAGNGVIDLGTQQMMSVPYALYADDVKISVSSTGDTLNLGSTALVVPGISNSANGTNYQYIQGAGVTDIDGNFYPTVIIKDQEWMSENLRVARFNDGSIINYGEANPSIWNYEQPAFCSYYGNPTNDTLFGKIYNFYAARGILLNGQFDDYNLCPTGWHVPSVVDCIRLLSNVNDGLYLNNVSTLYFGNNFTEGLKSFSTWPADSITQERNVFGFNAKSLGYLMSASYSQPSPIAPVSSDMAYFWTRSYSDSPGFCFVLTISPTMGDSNKSSIDSRIPKDGAFIRCIKD
jgi:uncharacterized protein (TIGR02145 family)